MKLVIYKDKKKEYRWRLKATNGRVLADSGEGYKRKSTCVKMAKKLFYCYLDLELIDED